MEDYEVTNARTWDDEIPPPPEPPGEGGFEWTMVGNLEQNKEKKKKQQQLKHKPQLPTQQKATPRQLEVVPAQHSASRRPQTKHYIPPRPAFRVTGQRKPSKWQRTGNRHIVRSRSPPRLHPEADNEAQLLWRQHKSPLDTVAIPPELDFDENTRKLLNALARELGAYVDYDMSDQDAAQLHLGIWGNEANVSAAKNALQYRIEDLMSQKGRIAAFAKVVSLTPAARQRCENRWAREVKNSRFRQFPPQDMPFGAMGSFHWPSKEYRPEEVLGLNSEALDPVRMEHRCYIAYVPDLSIFQVMGAERNVKKALQNLRRSVFQLTARSINPARTYLMYWSPGANVPTHVYLETYPGTIVMNSTTGSDTETMVSPRAEGVETSTNKIDQHRSLSIMNTERIRVTLGNALRKIHFYQGHVQLRVRLGVFLLSSYRMPDDAVDEDPSNVLYELKEFEAMTKEAQFFGRVTEEIGDTDLESGLLEVMLSKTDLLVPHGAMTASLRDVKPSYSAVFVFDDIYGALRLSMSWHELEDKKHENPEFILENSKWSRLERDTDRATGLLDMSSIDLHTGSAWQFEITASRAIEESKLPQNLRDFVARVSIDPTQATKQSTDKPFVRYNPFIKLRSLRQEISYRYNIQNSDYTLELRRFQDRSFSAADLTMAKPDVSVYEPRWGLNVLRTDWDTCFSKNECLSIGKAANWNDGFDEWFPSDIGPNVELGGDGFGQLLEKLQRIGKAVRAPHLSDGEKVEV